MPYVEARLAEGVPLHAMTRHVLGLFNGRPGARAWRRHLSTQAVRPGAGIEVLRAALDYVRGRYAEAEAAE
jgi:tRNA-dihydrouridine synthase A